MGKCLLPAHWCILQSLQNNFYPIKSFTTECYMQQYLAFFPPATALKLSSCNNTNKTVSNDKQVHASHCHAKPLSMPTCCAEIPHTQWVRETWRKRLTLFLNLRSLIHQLVRSLTQHNTWRSWVYRELNIACFITDVPNKHIPSVSVWVSSTALVDDWPSFSS